VTAGGDGKIEFWDKFNKRRVRTLIKIGAPITAMDINSELSILAYAKGYDWNKGINGAGRVQPDIKYRPLTEAFRSQAPPFADPPKSRNPIIH
jgi:hypothetical protein